MASRELGILLKEFTLKKKPSAFFELFCWPRLKMIFKRCFGLDFMILCVIISFPKLSFLQSTGTVFYRFQQSPL